MHPVTPYRLVLTLLAGIGTTGLAHADPIPPDLEPLYATTPDVSAQRAVRRPAAIKVAMTASSSACQSIACRNYLVIGVSH